MVSSPTDQKFQSPVSNDRSDKAANNASQPCDRFVLMVIHAVLDIRFYSDR